MVAYRAVHGIDFDGVGDEPGIRVEPGELMPSLSTHQVHHLKGIGAIERADDEAPKRRGKADS